MATRKFRLKRGTHSEAGVTYSHNPDNPRASGNIIETERDLVAVLGADRVEEIIEPKEIRHSKK